LGSHVDDENALVLAVEDSGIGMTNEHIAIAMTKFGQVSNAFDRENEGTGLGLPLTKSLVDLHGGHMNIISQLGIGTTVEVRLPPDRIIAA
jgi:signal transduction histidine kinase